jgi:2-amino-4-hydroxy-6-hydroxymethyldihydropteridine diphosphokinase
VTKLRPRRAIPAAPRAEAEVYVALGSNLGDRAARLGAALEALRGLPRTRLVARSRIYETAPVGPPQRRYLNAVAQLRTRLAPRALLARLLAIERAQGRRRGSARNAPRTLDLDLLLYDDLRIAQPDLEIPHPRLHQRAFVLEPLRELAGSLVHPTLGVTVDRLAARVCDPAAVRPWRDVRRESSGRQAMAIAAVSISPVGKGVSVGRFVAEALRVAQEQERVRHRLDPMFTTLEGELGEIFALVQRMQEAVFRAGARRVSTVIKIDDRRDRRAAMEEKVRSVERALAQRPGAPRKAARAAAGVKRRARASRS